MSTPWRSQKIRRPRDVVTPWVLEIERRFENHGPWDVHTCGSWRRGAEQVGDLDVLVVTDNGEFPVDMQAVFGDIIEFERGGEGLANGNIKLPDGDLHVDFYSTTERQCGAFLWFLTGPMDLNIQMRATAMAFGWMLNQYGLWRPVPWQPLRREDGEGWHVVPEPAVDGVLCPESFKTKKATQEFIDTMLVPTMGRLQIDDGTELSIAQKLGYMHLLEPSSRQDRQPAFTKSTHKVPSADGSTIYEVSVWSQDGRTRAACTCPGFKYRRKCRHIEGRGTPSAW